MNRDLLFSYVFLSESKRFLNWTMFSFSASPLFRYFITSHPLLSSSSFQFMVSNPFQAVTTNQEVNGDLHALRT